VLVVGFPIRAAVSLLVLAASLTGIARLVIDLVPTTIDALVRVIGAG
jgi:flagellar biosynthesis protein FliR